MKPHKIKGNWIRNLGSCLALTGFLSGGLVTGAYGSNKSYNDKIKNNLNPERKVEKVEEILKRNTSLGLLDSRIFEKNFSLKYKPRWEKMSEQFSLSFVYQDDGWQEQDAFKENFSFGVPAVGETKPIGKYDCLEGEGVRQLVSSLENQKILESISEKLYQEKGGLPEKNFKIELSSLPYNYEANSWAWYSAIQLFSGLSDYIGVKSGFDKDILGRMFLTGLGAYLSTAIGYYSHEMGHDFVHKKHGEAYGFQLDFSDWWSVPLFGIKALGKIPAFPKYVQKPLPDFRNKFSERDFFRRMSADGLNMDEYNAKTIAEEGLLSGNIDVFDRIAFLSRKFSDIEYIFRVGLENKGLYKTGLGPYDLYKYLKNTGALNDVDYYISYLHNQGVGLSKKKYLRQSMISDFCSLDTLVSIASIFKYVTKGETSSEPLTFRLKNARITPPLISHYITENGSLYDISSFINPGEKHPIKLSFVKYVGPTKDREKDFRLGGQYFYLPLGSLKASPYFYLNVDGSTLKPQGFSAGTELDLNLGKNNGLWAKVEYNKGDLIENLIKGEKEGFRISFGVKFQPLIRFSLSRGEE